MKITLDESGTAKLYEAIKAADIVVAGHEDLTVGYFVGDGEVRPSAGYILLVARLAGEQLAQAIEPLANTAYEAGEKIAEFLRSSDGRMLTKDINTPSLNRSL